jgi:hypothetical protein
MGRVPLFERICAQGANFLRGRELSAKCREASQLGAIFPNSSENLASNSSVWFLLTSNS